MKNDSSAQPKELTNLFAAGGSLHTYGKGEIMLRTDVTPPGVFCIKKGYVKVYSITDTGEENLHIIYGPDTIFPIIWAVTGKLRQVFYEAMDQVSAYKMSQEDFLAYIHSDAASAATVLDKVVDMFTVYANRIDILELTRSSSRIINRLIELADRHGTAFGSGILIQAPVKHHDIGNSTNCSRETVSREMEKLEKKGLIKYEDHLIVITNLKKLQEELRS